jgi:ArsR family transcriptional regulator
MALRELPELRVRGTCCELPPVDGGWIEDTARVLKAIADPTRLTILSCLLRARGPVCICDFTASLELSQPTISHHMAKLRDAGLVESEKRGIWVHYWLRPELPASVSALLRSAP